MKTFCRRVAVLATLAGACACAFGQTIGGPLNAASLTQLGFAPRGAHVMDAVQAQAQAAVVAKAPTTGTRTISLLDGSHVTIGSSGIGVRTDAKGVNRKVVTVPMPLGKSRIGGAFGPTDDQLRQRFALPLRPATESSMIVVLSSASAASGALTTDPQLDEKLRAAGTKSLEPLFGRGQPMGAAAVTGGMDLSRAYVAKISGTDAAAAARQLRSTPGVAYAAPNWNVTSMLVGARPIPPLKTPLAQGTPLVGAGPKAAAPTTSLPSNYGVATSMQSYLNTNGVDSLAAYAQIVQRFGQLPGQGTIITNVCLGDLTDQSMADAGDFYVQVYGPTTVVNAGQRYLDIPSMPLIPTFTVDGNGNVDPLGTVEFVDPSLGEVLLDFSVMAPLPHDQQRPEALGSQQTDLLGIAPGAQYRLVVPQQPTIANILVALQVAAQQTPRPDVITMSLGYGTDGVGFPGRYLEDDPLTQAIVKSVVASGIVVTISSNDGTRLFTNAAVGPDGGATPTDLAGPFDVPTSIADDAASTTPSLVPDTGAITVGGSTLDDIFGSPPIWKRSLSGQTAFPETRHNGGTYYASGFGTRVNVSAPSDNIAVLAHACPFDGSTCTAQSVAPVLEGGTSASTPMTAAAAAVLRQVARLTGNDLTPVQVRALLMQTGRSLPNPPQADRIISVGKQIDVAAAVETLLASRGITSSVPQIVRLGVAQRTELGNLGGDFVEITDPSAIDLMAPYDPFTGAALGQNAVSPITLSADVIGRPSGSGVQYRWTIGNVVKTSSDLRSLRMLPADMLAAAGMNLVSTTSRSVPVKFEVRRGNQTLASSSLSLGFGPTDGTYVESLAPRVSPVVQEGAPVHVRYDISQVQGVNAPVLMVSSVDHWNPATGILFRAEYTLPLTALSGSVDIPASAFKGGAGVYGIGIMTDTDAYIFGEFAAVRITRQVEGEGSLQRPAAPRVALAGDNSFGHTVGLTRASPKFQVSWDVSTVPGATGAVLEVSPPGPTIYGLLNTFNNPNGDTRDSNGGDNPSQLAVPLSGASGTTTLDALALGVPSSMFYTVRVLAVNGDRVVGQASPVSTLTLDDGIAPGGGEVIDFDIAGHRAGSVTVSQFGFTGGFGLSELASSVYQYEPKLGQYGATLASDTTGAIDYHVIGSDRSLNRTMVIGLSNIANDEYVNVYNNDSGSLVSSSHLDVTTQPYLIGARVDPVRHRAAILGWSSADFSDQILPFDLRSGQLGNAIPADVGTTGVANFDALDIDRSTGKMFPTGVTLGDLCFLFAGDLMTSVDLDARTAEPASQLSTCVSGVTADEKGNTLQLTIGPLINYILLPDGRTQVVDQKTLVAADPTWIGEQSPFFPVVDREHNLLLVGFLSTNLYYYNNTATSAIGVFDLATGNMVNLIKSFNLFGPVQGDNYFFPSARGIQIDTKTRTGWTYGPSSAQVQQFSY